MPELSHAVWVTVTVWSLVLGGALLTPACGSLAMLLGFGAATAFVLWTNRQPRSATAVASIDPFSLALGFIAGATTYGGFATGIACVGLAIGLVPVASISTDFDFRTGLCVLVLSPVFEEFLYRDQLWRALVRTPVALRVLLTSALFALPHASAWPMLGTFLVGLALGLTRWLSNSAVLCVALHAGLNLGARVGETTLTTASLLAVGGTAYVLATVRMHSIANSAESLYSFTRANPN